MKVAFFVTGFPWLSETFIVNQIAGLIDRGHEVHIYANEIHSEAELHPQYLRYRLLERVRLRRSESRRGGLRKFGHRFLRGMREGWRHPQLALRALNAFAYGRNAASLDVLDMVLNFVARPSYDVVHCHFGANANDAAILMELGVLEGRLVATFHGHDIREGIAKSGKIYARLVRCCDAVYSISGYNRRWLESFGFDPARIVDHPVGIDVKHFSPRPQRHLPQENRPVTIVSVARLAPEKGIQYALQALAAVRDEVPDVHIRYRIIGGGPLAESLRTMAKQLGLDDRVEFMGPQDQDTVASVLAEADILLLPSVAEALPVSIMEAMACGLPVLATDVGSVAEMVRDGETGRLVPPDDPQALSRALRELLDDRDSWVRLGRAGRALVEQTYDIDVLNDRLVRHYQSLLAHEPVRKAAECATR